MPASRNTNAAVGLYAAVCRLYPRAFAERYRDEMVADFSDALEAARREHRLMAFGFGALMDLGLTLTAAHADQLASWVHSGVPGIDREAGYPFGVGVVAGLLPVLMLGKALTFPAGAAAFAEARAMWTGALLFYCMLLFAGARLVTATARRDGAVWRAARSCVRAASVMARIGCGALIAQACLDPVTFLGALVAAVPHAALASLGIMLSAIVAGGAVLAFQATRVGIRG